MIATKLKAIAFSFSLAAAPAILCAGPVRTDLRPLFTKAGIQQVMGVKPESLPRYLDLSDAGDVHFLVDLEGTPDAILSYRKGTLREVFRAGQTLPGTSLRGISLLYSTDNGMSSSGVAWFGTDDNQRLRRSLIVENGEVLLLPGNRLSKPSRAGEFLQTNAPTLVTYPPAYPGEGGPPRDGVLYLGSARSKRPIAGPGVPAGDSTFRFVNRRDFPGSGSKTVGPSLSMDGNVAFFATTADNVQGLWTGQPDDLRPLALINQPAPGGGGKVFRHLGSPAALDNGGAAFFANLDPAVKNSPTSDVGLWAGKPGELRLLARQGSPAPGAPQGVVFSKFERDGIEESEMWAPVSRGEYFAFYAELMDARSRASAGRGIWIGGPDGLRKLIGPDDPALGLLPGVRFNGWDVNNWFSSTDSRAELNAKGQVAFIDALNGGLYSGASSAWLVEPDGSMRMLAMKWDMVDMGDGVLRTIGGFDAISLNNRGEVVLATYFVDGTWGLVMIPEPGTALCAFVLAALALRPRRRPA